MADFITENATDGANADAGNQQAFLNQTNQVVNEKSYSGNAAAIPNENAKDGANDGAKDGADNDAEEDIDDLVMELQSNHHQTKEDDGMDSEEEEDSTSFKEVPEEYLHTDSATGLTAAEVAKRRKSLV